MFGNLLVFLCYIPRSVLKPWNFRNLANTLMVEPEDWTLLTALDTTLSQFHPRRIIRVLCTKVSSHPCSKWSILGGLPTETLCAFHSSWQWIIKWHIFFVSEVRTNCIWEEDTRISHLKHCDFFILCTSMNELSFI